MAPDMPDSKRGPLARVLSTRPAQKALALQEAHPRKAAAVLFLTGAGWDALTIFRIDSIFDNALIIFYLSLLGTLYVAATLHEAGKLKNRILLRYTRWYSMISQFLVGALFSMFIFFYSQSASWTETSVYLILLIALLVTSETLHDRMFSARLRMVLLFFVLASYLIYFVPILTGTMSHFTFLLGILGAAGILAALGRFLWTRGVFGSRKGVLLTVAALALQVLFLEVAYVQNWIPPVPMAVREAGVYHTVKHVGGSYRMRMPHPPWYRPFRQSESAFAYRPGDSVHVYTAIFAPTRIDKPIVHVWELLDADGNWSETDRIHYLVAGGRDEGFRGYTFKQQVEPGVWRVNVETQGGRLLTRIRFDVIKATEPIERWKWISD